MGKLKSAIKIAGAVLAGVGGAATIIDTVDTVVERYEYRDVHEIEYTDVYTINGVEVSFEEFTECLEQHENGTITNTTTKVLTLTNLNIDDIARVSDYLSFEYDVYGNVCGAKIISDKVVKVSYEYSESYNSYNDNGKFNSYGMKSVLHQDVSQTNGLFFIKGAITTDNYTITTDIQPNLNYYIFKFMENNSYSAIKFTDVFTSIKIEVK